MELRILRNFIAVVEEEGVSAAADALRISQPAFPGKSKIWKTRSAQHCSFAATGPTRSNLLRRAA